MTGAPLDGRIELKGLLGEGGMGEVHRAWDRALERPVAVKFFRGADPREAERLLLEGRLQARIEHDHVVRVHEVGTLGGRACLVLQLVEGRPLHLVSPALELAERAELLRQAALGVHAAHLQGLVHRDVKPANVLVEEGAGARRALVSDFGLARADEPGLTRSGMPAGTLAFMSPEQLLGTAPAGPRSDVYGLGATLYAALAGAPPRQTPGILTAGPSAPPPPLPGAVARPLARVVAKAMEPDPARRYPSALALAEDLGRFLAGEPVLARPAGWAERALAWSRRNRAAARLLALALAGAVAALGWAGWSWQRSAAQALEAARYGALGEALEARVRLEQMEPEHDLRPGRAALRAEVEALRAAAGQGGPVARFALARGLELLGDVDGALAEYQRAWDAGFRSPRVAEGIGLALSERYLQALQRARETLDPGAREARIAVLRRELRDPGLEALRQAGLQGGRAEEMAAAVALLEGDTAAARERAGKVLAARPRSQEALRLRARAALEDAVRASAEGKLDAAQAAAGEAIRALEAAQRIARSDPGQAAELVRAHLVRLGAHSVRGQQPRELLEPAQAAVAHLAALEPEEPATLAFQGELALQRATFALVVHPAEALQHDLAAVALLRRATAGQGDVRTLCLLARALYGTAYERLNRGEPVPALVEDGLAVLERAARLAPGDPQVSRTGALLRSVEARTLKAMGRPDEEVERAQRARVAAGEEAIRLGSRGTPELQRSLGDAFMELAGAAWRSGRDPRPDLERSLAHVEEAHRAIPTHVSIAVGLAIDNALAGQLLRAMGEDGWHRYARAAEVLRELLARQPGAPQPTVQLAQVLTAEAVERAAAGEDPRPATAEARRLFDAALPSQGDDPVFEQQRALLPYLEARWGAAHGQDPEPLLRAAERDLARLAARYPAEAAQAHEYLARIALERGLWEQRQGRAGGREARRGLALLDAPPQDPGEPALWLLRARLLALAGDAGGARGALERAWAVNARVRAGPESRAAEAQLVAPAPVP